MKSLPKLELYRRVEPELSLPVKDEIKVKESVVQALFKHIYILEILMEQTADLFNEQVKGRYNEWAKDKRLKLMEEQKSCRGYAGLYLWLYVKPIQVSTKELIKLGITKKYRLIFREWVRQANSKNKVSRNTPTRYYQGLPPQYMGRDLMHSYYSIVPECLREDISNVAEYVNYLNNSYERTYQQVKELSIEIAAAQFDIEQNNHIAAAVRRFNPENIDIKAIDYEFL